MQKQNGELLFLLSVKQAQQLMDCQIKLLHIFQTKQAPVASTISWLRTRWGPGIRTIDNVIIVQFWELLLYILLEIFLRAV